MKLAQLMKLAAAANDVNHKQYGYAVMKLEELLHETADPDLAWYAGRCHDPRQVDYLIDYMDDLHAMGIEEV